MPERSHPATVDPSTRRRNRIVLVSLLVFVVFAFAISFRHVAREAGGPAPDQEGRQHVTPSPLS